MYFTLRWLYGSQSVKRCNAPIFICSRLKFIICIPFIIFLLLCTVKKKEFTGISFSTDWKYEQRGQTKKESLKCGHKISFKTWSLNITHTTVTFKIEVRTWSSHSLQNTYVLQNETSIAEQLIKLGPLSVALNAELLQFYHHGVFDPPSFACDPKNLDHGLCWTYIFHAFLNMIFSCRWIFFPT